MPALNVFRLDCGLTLVTETMSGVRSAAVTWLLPAGAAHDPRHRQGLSSLWAELLLRGSASLDSRQQADLFDTLGITRSTEVGSLTFRLGAATLGQSIADALPPLVDMVLRPRFDPASLEPARDLAQQALDSLKDDPHERAVLLARERHHPDPFNRSGLGTPQGLADASIHDVTTGWAARAVPESSILAIAGAIEPRPLVDALNTLLQGWRGVFPDPVLDPAPPRGYAHEHEESNQVQIVIMHDAPPETADDAVLEKIAVSVLSGGMSGRLFSEVREKRGLCYAVSAGYRGDKAFGSVTTYAGTTPERAQDSLAVVLEQIHRLSAPEGRVTPDEFARAVIGLKSALVFSGESTPARAAAIASDVRRLGRPRRLDEIASAYDRATLDQLNAYLARRTLRHPTIQTLGPSPLTPPNIS